MEQSKFRQYSRLGQIGVWLLLLLIYTMESLEYADILESFLYALCTISCLIATAYFHYYFLLPLLNNRKRILYFSLTFLLIVLNSILLYWVLFYFTSDESYSPSFLDNFVYDFVLTTIIVGIVSLNYFVEAWYRNIQTESMLRSEKLQAELSFLKSQINPHFLFNTLNNIYSFAQTGNPKTAPMLERLSSILRFMVYDCEADRVELSKEVNAVEDLLEIHKMKNSEQRNMALEVEGVKGFHLIAPLIIVNFVENACKHSDVISNPQGFIRVRLSVDEQDRCLLAIHNSYKKKLIPDTKYQGVGLENIRKRLELQYHEAYSLKEDKKDNQYYLALSIPLERKQ